MRGTRWLEAPMAAGAGLALASLALPGLMLGWGAVILGIIILIAVRLAVAGRMRTAMQMPGTG